jgi:hypothetical protein
MQKARKFKIARRAIFDENRPVLVIGNWQLLNQKKTEIF